jgi:hypothetical protein
LVWSPIVVERPPRRLVVGVAAVPVGFWRAVLPSLSLVVAVCRPSPALLRASYRFLLGLLVG